MPGTTKVQIEFSADWKRRVERMIEKAHEDFLAGHHRLRIGRLTIMWRKRKAAA